MKVIPRMDLTENHLTSTTASEDDYPTWQPEGRDFSTDQDTRYITAAGDKLFIVEQRLISGEVAPEPDQLRYHDLTTGQRLDSPINTDILINGAAMSPDAVHLALTGQYTESSEVRYGLRVYDVSDPTDIQLVYSARVRRAFATISWSEDSSTLFYISSSDFGGSDYKRGIYALDIPTLTPAIVADMEDIEPNATFSGPCDIHDVQANADGTVVWAIYTENPFSVYGKQRGLARVVVSSGAITKRKLTDGSTGGPDLIAWNEVRSELLLARSSVFSVSDTLVLDDTTLDPAPTAPAWDGMGILSLTISNADGELIVLGSAGEDPRYLRFDAANYAAGTPLDSVLADAGDIVYSADYYVARMASGGFSLVALADDTLVEQVNPLVSPPSVFVYNAGLWEVIVESQDRPDAGAKSDPPTWVSRGPVNRLRLFDGKIGTYTEAEGDLAIDIKPGKIVGGIALFGLLGRTLRVQVIHDGGTVYDTGTVSLADSSGIDGWYAHFFGQRGLRSDYVITALPPYPDPTVRVTVGEDFGTARIGELVLGRVVKIADLQNGGSVQVLDFSTKSRDEFGAFSIIERDFAKIVDYPVSLRTNRISPVFKFLASLRARASVYIGADSEEETIAYGFYRDFQLYRRGPVYSEGDIEVESVT